LAEVTSGAPASSLSPPDSASSRAKGRPARFSKPVGSAPGPKNKGPLVRSYDP
jgi:hypothetical protein